MKNIVLFFICLIYMPVGCGQSIPERIDSLMKSYYKPDQPGSVIAIMKNQTIIFKSTYGLSNLVSGKRLTTDDNFNIGSLTKQFTAYSVLLLNHYGKLSLNDSIGKYLKLPVPLASIRISQLMSHSSGIPDHYGFTDTHRVKHATDKDVLEAIQGADSLYFPSGTRYRYSNTAYCLLGMLIEKITGVSYSSFLHQEIFSPLKIKNATVFNFNKPVKHRVTGYRELKNGDFAKADAEESIFFSTEADGGLYISMNDYLKWCVAVKAGNFQPRPDPRNSWQKQTLVDTAGKLWYGYGWFILESGDSGKIVYHTGSNGGFCSVVLMIPSLEYCISIFSNRTGTDLEDVVARINLILQIPDNSFIKSGPLESFKHSWPKFAPCKETSSFSTLFKKNLNAKGMVLN